MVVIFESHHSIQKQKRLNGLIKYYIFLENTLSRETNFTINRHI